MNRLQQEHGDWGNNQFSSHFKNGSPNPLAPFNHLLREMAELREALEKGHISQIADEIADCQLLLYSIAHLCGIDVERSAWDKYHINRSRRWGEPDAHGVVEHIR